MMELDIQLFGGRGAYFDKKGLFRYSVNSKENKEDNQNNKPKTIVIENKKAIKDLQFNGDTIPKGTIITDVHVFAGDKVKESFRNASRWNKLYNLESKDEKDWIHSAGKFETKTAIYDIHMVEHPKVGIVDMYVKHKTEKRK